MTSQISILLVEDHTIVRGGLAAIIGFEADMKVVGEASDGVEAVEMARRLKPDVIIMDLLMPRMDGIEAMAHIRAEDPDAHILVLTSFGDTDKMLQAVKAGAQGYILKNAPPEELLNAIRDVSRGAISFQPAIAHQIIDGLSKSERVDTQEEPLTARETEVLVMIANGLSNDDIAEKLTISKRTVNVHINNIMGKLHLANRAQAAIYAVRKGLITVF